jgi:ABC-type transport system involved in cytochrome c biogenesis permease subunit
MIRTAFVLSLFSCCACSFWVAPLVAEDTGGQAASATLQTSAAPAAKSAVAHPAFDWSEWQRLPVQHDGRVKPLDSLADELVNLVTGRSKWTDPEAKTPVTYSAPELLYGWITRPEEWIDRPILRCEYRPLRKLLSTDKIQVPVEGTFVALGQILDWKQSNAVGRPVYWSKDFESRIEALQKSPNKSPDSIGDTADDRAINGKVAELFRHMEAFLALRHGATVFIVPGLDPRALTRQTDPDDRINAWVALGAILESEKWKTNDDLTVAAVMAEDPRELARELLNPDRDMRYSESHPNHPRSLVAILPQLAQAQKSKGELQTEIRGVKQTLDKNREAYDAGDAQAFASTMHAFVEQVRRLAHAMESARTQMVPPAKNSLNFGEAPDDKLNEIIWTRYEPQKLSEAQMRFSAYPAPGSTDTEILYNQYKPFQSAWIIFLTALVVIVLSGMLKSSRTVYAAGLLITLAAIAYSAWGFALRVRIAGRPPVTNMYETVIWASFIVSLLGLWFCMLPFTWPGLSWGWRLAGLPLRLRSGGSPLLPKLELDRPGADDQGKFLSGALVPVQCLTSVVRLAAFAATVWFFTRSGTSFRIIEFVPPIFGKAIAWSSLGTWMVGIAVVVGAAWFGSRAAVTLALLPVTLVPEALRQGDKFWEQTFQRRYFLIGALPVVSFGMMLAHFVGISSPDIMNPRIGSITAVLRNNYWLTIHVLTIVSSYGAGGLAWGLGNLAMLFYLFGKYRPEGSAAVSATASGSLPVSPPVSPPNGGPIFDLNAAYGSQEPSLASRLKKAGKALKPTMLPRTIKAGFEDFGTGDEHLEAAKVRPPKEAATLATYTYKAQQVAVLLLAAGTILGGLWADVSWGRFWDWDPKEVWALISLLAYLVVLHGRFAGWVGTFGTNAGGVLAFSAILFSWYGVNFVLPMVHGWLNGTNMPTEVGLHAYAVGSGGLAYVVGGVLLNLLLVVAAWGRYAAETTDLLSRSAASKLAGRPAPAGPAPEAPV